MVKSIGEDLEVSSKNGAIRLTLPEDVSETTLNNADCINIVSFILKENDLTRVFKLDSCVDLNNNLEKRETLLKTHGNDPSLYYIESIESGIAKEVDTDSELRVRMDSSGYTYYMTPKDGLNLARHLVRAFGIHPTFLYENVSNEPTKEEYKHNEGPKVFEVERIFNG